MSVSIAFDLSDEDLEYFKKVMKRAQARAASAEEGEIISRAKKQLAEVEGASLPEFVASRLKKLAVLINMLEDDEWQIPEEERKDVVSALAYFYEPEDLVPDDIPGLGYLDDAIMIELVALSLDHEIDAFNEFCAYRVKEEANRKDDSQVTREEWVAKKRDELHNRMRDRRRNRFRRPAREGRRVGFTFY